MNEGIYTTNRLSVPILPATFAERPRSSRHRYVAGDVDAVTIARRGKGSIEVSREHFELPNPFGRSHLFHEISLPRLATFTCPPRKSGL